MRQHVTPADPGAKIPTPSGDYLPAAGLDVEMSAYWYVMANRGDVIVTAPVASGVGTPAPAVGLQLTDVLPLVRGGVGGSVTIADLVAFLAPLLGGGGGTTAPSADNQSGALLPLGLP